MFKPLVKVYIPSKDFVNFPKVKQCENQMYDYVFHSTSKDFIFCKTNAKSLWYYQSVIFQDLVSIAENIIYSNSDKVGYESSLTNGVEKPSLKLRLRIKREKALVDELKNFTL